MRSTVLLIALLALVSATEFTTALDAYHNAIKATPIRQELLKARRLKVVDDELVQPSGEKYYSFYQSSHRMVDSDLFALTFDAAGVDTDAAIKLTVMKNARPSSENAYEVVLGSANGKSVIRYGTGKDGIVKAVAATPDVNKMMKDGKSHSFWVTLEDDKTFVPEDKVAAMPVEADAKKWAYVLTVGTGSTIGENVLLRAPGMPYLGKDLVAFGLGSTNGAVEFTHVNLPKAKLSTVEDDDIKRWSKPSVVKSVLAKAHAQRKALQAKKNGAKLLKAGIKYRNSWNHDDEDEADDE